MRRFASLDPIGHLNIRGFLNAFMYPRKVGPRELSRSSFYMYGVDAIFWLERVIGDHTTAVFHLAVRPETQKNHGVAPRKLFRGLDVICDLEGIDRLIANDCTESGEVTDYLVRLGWKPCTMETIEGEWYERSFVDGEAEKDSHEQASETEDRPSESGRGSRSQDRGDRERAKESRSAAGPGSERLRTP